MTHSRLFTKSILKKGIASDGIRVCVMRRIKPEYKFDIWIPELGPSTHLLNKYIIAKSIKWKNFKVAYKAQLLRKKSYVGLIKYLLQTSAVTLLCVETGAVRCHRSLLAKECSKGDSNLKIVHR